MCEICDAFNRIELVPEEELPEIKVTREAVVVKMSPEYQAKVLDNEGNSYVILSIDQFLTELITDLADRLGIDITSFLAMVRES